MTFQKNPLIRHYAGNVRRLFRRCFVQLSRDLEKQKERYDKTAGDRICAICRFGDRTYSDPLVVCSGPCGRVLSGKSIGSSLYIMDPISNDTYCCSCAANNRAISDRGILRSLRNDSRESVRIPAVFHVVVVMRSLQEVVSFRLLPDRFGGKFPLSRVSGFPRFCPMDPSSGIPAVRTE